MRSENMAKNCRKCCQIAKIEAVKEKSRSPARTMVVKDLRPRSTLTWFCACAERCVISSTGTYTVLADNVARNLFPSRCWASVALDVLPAREHGYLRSGHVTEATSPVEVLTTSLSLHFTMGPLKCVISDSFCHGEEDSRLDWPLVCYSSD